MFAFLRTVAMWAFSLSFWGAFLAIYWLSLCLLPWRAVAGAARFWGRCALWILGIRVIRENAPMFTETQEARVLVFNHQSSLDFHWGATVCPLAPLVIGKKEVIFIPMFNLIWWTFRFIRIDRKDREKALAALQGVAEKTVRERRTLVISPEGTRARDGEVLPFRKGAFHIAIEGQLPIYAIVVAGAGRLNPRGHFSMRSGTLRMAFLPPYETRGLKQADKDALIARVQADVTRKYEELNEALTRKR